MSSFLGFNYCLWSARLDRAVASVLLQRDETVQFKVNAGHRGAKKTRVLRKGFEQPVLMGG